MGLLQDCKKYFGTSNVYEILNIKKNCSGSDIKKAYKRLSLLHHPDRVSDEYKEEATKKFQVISKLHFILSDKEKKAIYDDTGDLDDEDGLSENRDWFDYWRLLFPRVKEEDIVKCLNEYRGSEDEKKDLKNHYLRFKGDMNKISEYLIGYDFEEEDRYHEIINEMIEEDEVPNFPKFTKESAAKKNARKRRYEKEAAEADKMKEEINGSLVQAIAKRANERFDDMISQLEKKYAKPSPKSKEKKRTNKKRCEEPASEDPLLLPIEENPHQSKLDRSSVPRTRSSMKNDKGGIESMAVKITDRARERFEDMIQELEEKYVKPSLKKERKTTRNGTTSGDDLVPAPKKKPKLKQYKTRAAEARKIASRLACEKKNASFSPEQTVETTPKRTVTGELQRTKHVIMIFPF